jgi:hypothetical protein
VKALPVHWRRQASERLKDLNPFAMIAANGDLLRAVHLAWIEAAPKHRCCDSLLPWRGLPERFFNSLQEEVRVRDQYLSADYRPTHLRIMFARQ